MDNLEIKTNMLLRLKRIEGQIRGIQKMIEEDRECGDIAQQLQAVRSAVHATNKNMIQHYLEEGIQNADISPKRLTEINRLFNYLE